MVTLTANEPWRMSNEPHHWTDLEQYRTRRDRLRRELAGAIMDGDRAKVGRLRGESLQLEKRRADAIDQIMASVAERGH